MSVGRQSEGRGLWRTAFKGQGEAKLYFELAFAWYDIISAKSPNPGFSWWLLRVRIWHTLVEVLQRREEIV